MFANGAAVSSGLGTFWASLYKPALHLDLLLPVQSVWCGLITLSVPLLGHGFLL